MRTFTQPVILRPDSCFCKKHQAEESQAGSFASLRMTRVLLTAFFILSGCSAPPAEIPDISKDHPANKFFQAAQQGMLSDRVCRDNKGDPSIPIGKIEKGEGYAKLEDLTAGVFRFEEKRTGKRFLGVSFLQYSGFLQIPKVCAWEEKDSG